MFNKVLILILSAFITACSIVPERKTATDMISFGNKEIRDYYNLQETPKYAMDIYEVSARVLKYNIGRQLKQMELNLTEAKLSEYKSNMLTKLNTTIANQSHTAEDIRKTKSVHRSDGTVSPSFSNTSEVYSDKNYTSANLELSNNTLDFSINYFTAKLHADRILVSRENRRKAIFELLEKSHSLYWFIIAVQRNERLIFTILENIDKGLSLAQTASADSLPQENLKKRRDLLKFKRAVRTFLHKINQSKIELASLMGLPSDTKFTLYNHSEKLPVINLSTVQMDEFLFANHPDMRIAAYKEKISLTQSKIAFYKLFPSFSLGIGSNLTTDSYQQNKSYTYAGAAISYNLLSIFKFGTRNKIAKIEKLFAQNSRIASGVAVLTSARIRELLYQDAMSRYADNVNLHMIEKQISRASKSKTQRNTSDYYELVEALVGELEAGLARATSYSKLTEFALSIGSVLNPSEFDYNINKVELSTLKHMIKLELGRMPISWLRLNDRYSIPSKNVKKEVDKVFKLWRLEKYRGVKEGGDNKFKPNSMPNSALNKYSKPLLKPIGKKPEFKETKVKKPVIKMLKPKVQNPIVKENNTDNNQVVKQPDDAVNQDVYELLEKVESELESN